jgi:hypothetical protein
MVIRQIRCDLGRLIPILFNADLDDLARLDDMVVGFAAVAAERETSA